MIPASCQRPAPVYIFKREERSVSERGGRGEVGLGENDGEESVKGKCEGGGG